MAMTETRVPPLESGDRLTQCEFHRRYLASPHLTKAELVEGVVYVPSPVSRSHSRPHLQMSTWIGAYLARHPDLEGGDNGTVILDGDNEVQPDVCLRRAGDANASEPYIIGAPELVIEIAASSASYDLHDKMRAYRRNGVQEYIVWRVYEAAIDWFRLVDGEYVRVQPDASGAIESTTFPGLRLHVAKMLAGDLQGVLAEVRTEN